MKAYMMGIICEDCLVGEDHIIESMKREDNLEVILKMLQFSDANKSLPSPKRKKMFRVYLRSVYPNRNS